MSQQFQQVSYMNLMSSFQGALSAQYALGGQTAFTQVRDSRENLFASNLMPLPPKFAFQERTGRINWRALMNTDLDRISKEIDLKSLETLLQNITFAQLDRDDLERLGDAHFIKLFRLSQYSIEYLLYTQNYMESLCKTLDVEYKQTYERTLKTEEAIKKYQSEMKLMRKELKLKQKTLSTYEYLMKLPVEQEQDVIKCKQCLQKPKFFLNKAYLQKHYQRNHPEVDFQREFSEMNGQQNDNNFNSINERQLQTTLEKSQQQQKLDQEELFDKIKKELFVSLSDNFKNIEQELHVLKDKANYSQIQTLLENYENKNEQEQKKIQESLNKPAKMMEELKSKWGDMFQQQSTGMRDMIAQSVNEALSKRKDDREKKKMNQTKNSDTSNEMSQLQEQKVKFFEQRINEFDEKFKENERIKQDLERKLKEYEKMLQEKGHQEKELQQKLMNEEEKRKEGERLRKVKEQELMEQLNSKAQEELKIQLAEEQRIRDENEQKLKHEQQEKQNEEMKKKQQEEQKLKQSEEEKLALIAKQQEEEKLKQKEEEAKKLKLQQQQEEEQKKKQAEEQKKKQQEEEEAKKKQQQVDDSVEEIIEEEEEEEVDDEEEVKKEDIVKEANNQPTVAVQDQQPKLSAAQLSKQKMLATVKQEFEKDNIYEGDHAHIKSLFNHSLEQVDQKKSDVLIELTTNSEQILLQEFQTQKIQEVPEKSNPLSATRKEELKHVNEMLKGLPRKEADKINNSLLKRLNDQSFAPYNQLIDVFLQKALR